MTLKKYKTKTKGTLWYERISINQRRYFKRGFKTRKEAEEYGHYMYRLVGQRLNAPKLSEAVASYLEISKQQVKITTYQKLKLRMNKYILGMLPDIRIDQLNYLDLSKWWNGIKRLKIQDKNIFLNDLKRFFEHVAVYFNCRNEEVNKLIPYKDYSIKTHVRPLKYITYDDFKKFLKVSADSCTF